MKISKILLWGFGALIIASQLLYIFGWYPPHFELEWDEEVKLHDGRMIVVHIKRKFTRRGRSRTSKYENVTYDGTEVSFDAGEPWGRYTRYFQGYQPLMIENLNGTWYLHLNDASPGAGPNPRIVKESYPILMLKPDGTEEAVNDWSDVPDFPILNVMNIRSSARIAKVFHDAKILNWDYKKSYWIETYPQGINYINRGFVSDKEVFGE